MFDAVIFDMDGTLVNSEPIDMQAWFEVVNHHEIEISLDELLRLAGNPTPRIVEYLEKRHGHPLPDGVLQEKRNLFYNLAKERLEPMPGVFDCLRYLKSRRIPIGIASASEPERIRVSLKKTKLDHEFDVVISGEDVKENKPAPDAYLYAAKCLCVEPECCVAVEDSVPGITSAKRAGMTVIGYTSSFSEDILLDAGASVTFHSYEEITKHLGSLQDTSSS